MTNSIIKHITKIVLTGGPCGGKTTGIAKVKDYFEKIGYSVFIVPEIVTMLKTNGATPSLLGTYSFQRLAMSLQKQYENQLERNISMNDRVSDKILIICDRGYCDAKAYCDERTFDKVVKDLFDEPETASTLANRYDGIFVLSTAAKGAEKYYTCKNNEARSETSKEAIAVEERIIDAYIGHSHLRVIDNSTDFDNKIKRLIKEIASLLGEPEPIECERKWLIAKPNENMLLENQHCTKVHITQNYLVSDDGKEERVRKRVSADGTTVYYHTIKRNIDGLRRFETEKIIDEAKYSELLKRKDARFDTVEKDRYCLLYMSQYFEIDLYKRIDECAIMELEIADNDTRIITPNFLNIIRDVTKETSWKNKSLAKAFHTFTNDTNCKSLTFRLTDEGIKKADAFVAECKAKRKEILDANRDTATNTPQVERDDIISDLNFGVSVDADLEYYNRWGVTDNYDSDNTCALKYGEDFMYIHEEI